MLTLKGVGAKKTDLLVRTHAKEEGGGEGKGGWGGCSGL
jgi:hypothetical protein